MASLAQLIAAGLSEDAVRAQVAAGRWQRVWPGIVATFTGPLPATSRIWAATLHAGRGAVLAGATALWLGGALDTAPTPIRVCVPHGRKVIAPPGVVITGRRNLQSLVCPAARPRRMPVEEALLDEVARCTSTGVVVGLVLQVMQRRVTTPDRVLSALTASARQRHRALVRDLIDEARDGVQSRLEHLYRTDIEQAHGLPTGVRNVAELVAVTGDIRPRRRYRDVRYAAFGLLIELDGEAAHPKALDWRDKMRDNDAMLGGDRTLRYGWREVAHTPCLVAEQVAQALRVGGWAGTPRRCGPGCGRSASTA